VRKLAHFAGKSALDIDGLGMKTVKLLMEHELVANVDDLFDLTKDELLELPGFKEKSADNLLAALSDKKRVPLDRLLVGLSIPHVGEETARVIAMHFGTLAALRDASPKAFSDIHGIGEVVARACSAWFSDPENQTLLERLAAHLSVSVLKKERGTGALEGVSVVITGSFEGFSREEAEAMVRKAGGKPSGSVSKKTGFVVAGEKPGSKREAAQKLGIPIINEAEFVRRVGA
jgi:DNA ligase (NAD+)